MIRASTTCTVFSTTCTVFAFSRAVQSSFQEKSLPCTFNATRLRNIDAKLAERDNLDIWMMLEIPII